MIDIDKETFEKYVLAATSSTAEVFDMIEPSLKRVELQLEEELLGTSSSELVSIKIEDLVKQMICLRAFYEQIPHLDLVLTPTGFGIVNNQNVSPASAERVKALRDQVRNSYESAYDRCIVLLTGADWAVTEQALQNIPNMIYLAKHLETYGGKKEPYRSDMLSQRSAMYVAEEQVQRKISLVQFDDLLHKIRANSLTANERSLVHLIRQYVGCCLRKKENEAALFLQRLENTIESYLDQFPLYKNSQEYQVKHFTHYENQKRDSTYFFG